MLMQRRPDLLHMRAVGADGFVELLAGDVELFGPVGDVGRQRYSIGYAGLISLGSWERP